MNTNYAPKTDAEANLLGDDLQDAMEAFLADNDIIRRLIKFRDGAGARDFTKILSIDAVPRREIGPAHGMLHAHILVDIKHTVGGRGIHLNVDALRAGLRKYASYEVNRRMAYINITAGADRAILAAYVRKGDIAPDPAAMAAIRGAAAV